MKQKIFPSLSIGRVLLISIEECVPRYGALSRAEREDKGLDYLEFIFSTVNRTIYRLPGRIIRQDEFLRGHALVLDSDRKEFNSFFDP